MTVNTLYLAQFDDDQPLTAYDIKQRDRRQFLGRDWTFTIIGSSHYISCPDLEYYELLSCEPVENTAAKSIQLSVGTNHMTTYTTASLRVETFIEGRPLGEFPDPEQFELTYQFGDDAYTTINRLGQRVYETYHTYPEHDLALYTQAVFFDESTGSSTQSTADDDATSTVIHADDD